MLIVKPRLSEILKARDMTQMDISMLSKVPQSAISRFDKNTQHSDIHLFSISRALGINVEELFEVTEDSSTK